jgi:REP element-mobilizing transposase RayT
MLRGINQQSIFEDTEDYLKFLEILEKYKTICQYKVFAYCLMSNHIHLLLKIEDVELDLTMKRLAGSYAQWYNWKYYRKGHVFQDRFRSEPIEDDAYFLTVLRYIHQNPIKAGLASLLEEYQFCSYFDYFCNESNLLDMDFAFSILSKEAFIAFNNQPNADVCLELDSSKSNINDIDAKKMIKRISNCDNVAEFQRLPKEQREKYILKMKESGISIRQISRLTGTSFYLARKL